MAESNRLEVVNSVPVLNVSPGQALSCPQAVAFSCVQRESWASSVLFVSNLASESGGTVRYGPPSTH